MGKSVENYSKKRELIRDTAKRLFLENGYGATSMDTVAKESGVTKQTVYRYFPSKEELFSAVLGGLCEDFGGYVFGRRGVLEELIRFAEDFISLHMQKQRLSLYRMMIAEGGAETGIGMLFKNFNQSRRKKNLVEYLKDRVGVSEPEQYADMFCAMLLYSRPQILMGNEEIPDAEEIRNISQTAVEIFINGLLSL